MSLAVLLSVGWAHAADSAPDKLAGQVSVADGAVQPDTAAWISRRRDHAVRIVAPIGQVKLDIHKVTGGLARSHGGRLSRKSEAGTFWSQ
jgi:hypothetical protein